MERIEPTMATLAGTPELSDVAGGEPIGTSRVRFNVLPRRGQRGTGLRSMLRKGELCVTDENVALIKSSRKLFQRPIEMKRVIPRSQIFDVRIIRGKYVYFDIHALDGIQRVVLIASSRDEAENSSNGSPGKQRLPMRRSK
ncbi:hypothetical protein [Pseudomonas batumici]|uniref:hypothetical protein n=1 Tax=Pseudomonas batumici TaxID=226910 RepID=UPI00058A364F|nr:hypothetical protein [Pseudomonas batumici]